MPKTSTNKDGFVLVTVVWLLAILTVIAIGFSYRAMLERRAAWYDIDHAQARTLARSAANRALFELRNKRTLDRYNAIVKRYNFDPQPYTGLDQHWSLSVNIFDEENYFTSYDPELNEGDICTYEITDCSSLIPINDAPEEILESIDELDFKVIGDIIARRETMNAERAPRRFASVDEVLKLDSAASIDRDLWFGSDDQPGLNTLFTVWSLPSDPRINVNTASRRVLESIPDMSEETVDAIMGYRAGPDGVQGTEDDRAFQHLPDVSRRLDIGLDAMEPIYKFCKVDSSLFKITAHATRRRGRINAWCTVIVEVQGAETIIRDWKEGIRG